MRSFTIISTILSLTITAARVAPAAENSAADLVAKIPATELPVGQQLVADLVKLAPAGIKAVVAMLAEPDKGGDAKARFAINGLALYVTRPGAETERAMFASVLVEALQASPTPDVKLFLINMLQLSGKDEAVPPLAALLTDANFVEPAAQALTRIATPSAQAALLKALPAIKDPQRPTLIRALGSLRLASASEALLPYATSPDAATRRLALWALANIGAPAAADALAKAAQAEGTLDRAHFTSLYLLFAQRLAEAGKADDCAKICRDLIKSRTAPRENNVLANALTTLAKATGDAAIPDLLTTTDSENLQLRSAAMRILIAMPGEAVGRALAAKLPQAPADRKAELLAALAARNDAAALPAIMQAMKDPAKPVRLAAIGALAQFATPQSVDALLAAMNTDQADEITAICASLARMSGEPAMAAIAAALPKVTPPARVTLLGILAARHAKSQLEPAFAATADPDAAVRLAALKAIGILADAPAIPRLLDLLQKSADAAEQEAVVRAIVQISQRSPDADTRADAVLAALPKTTGTRHLALLKSLPQLGGPKALAAAVAESASPDADTADAAIRALADWKDDSAIQPLLKLAQSAPKPNHQIVALRGLARLAALPNARPIPQTIQLYKDIIAAAKRPEEKRLAIAGLSNLHDLAALKALATYLDDEPLATDAAAAILRAASSKNQPLRGPEVTEILKKIAATAKDPALKSEAANLAQQPGK